MAHKYYYAPGPPDSNSWSILEKDRKNQWGEPYVVRPLLTLEQAKTGTDVLNELVEIQEQIRHRAMELELLESKARITAARLVSLQKRLEKLEVKDGS